MRKIIIFIAFLQFSCKHNTYNISKNEISTIKVKVEKLERFLDISKFYDAKFIPLEFSKNSIIGDIDKVIIHNNLIYVMDSQRAKKIFVFDMDGNFIRTIGNLGKGNGEYVVLCDFDIVGNHIYVSSQQDNNMLIFDLEGKYLKNVRFSGYIGMNFKVLKSGRFIVKNADGSNKSAIIYDSRGNESELISNSGINFMRYSNTYAFTEYENDYYMYFALNDTIYHIEDDKLIPKYFIDFIGKSIPYHNISTKKELIRYLENDNFMRFTYFQTFNKYHFIDANNGKLAYSILVNKENGDLFYANRFLYQGFPIYQPVGRTNNGPIFLWGPSSYPIYRDILKNKLCFIPKGYKESEINVNPGIVILTEK